MRRFLILTSVLASLLVIPAGAPAKSPPKPTRITLNVAARTLTAGQQFTARVKSVKPARASRKVNWSSSKKSVATVTRAGVVKAVGAGTATITARSAVRPRVTSRIRVTVKPKKLPVVVDKNLIGSWELITTGAGSIRTFNADGTWSTAVRFEAPVGPLQVFSQGNYQASNGQIRIFNAVTRSRKDDDEPWGPWKPAADPNRVEYYVVGTDEYGEYLIAEDSPGEITPDSVKYRRSE